MLCKLRALLLLIFIPLFTMICSLSAFLVFAPFLSRKACDGLIHFWAKNILKMAGVKLRIKGAENLSGLHSVILVSNHMSLFDIPVLFAGLPIAFRMAAKAELFDLPVFGRALKAFGFFPVTRENPGSAKQTLSLIEKEFERGGSLWMAPEGTRQRGDNLGIFKMGAFYLAMKANRTLIPVVVEGTQRVLPKNSILVNWHQWNQTVTLVVGAAEDPKEWAYESRHEWRNHVQLKMANMLREIRSSH